MELNNYFEKTEGTGSLATTDDEGTIGFIMRGRLSHRNPQTNPYAAYMFIENGPGYKGKRIYLEKIREETDFKVINEIRRKPRKECLDSGDEEAYLVYFHVYQIRPLVGDKN